MTYGEIVAGIENTGKFGNRTGKEISAVMLEQLGHPEAGIPFIHIAGTNGKGSVSAFLCEILQAAGLRTGCLTSPHLVDFRERIRVDGGLICEEDVVRLGETLVKQEFYDGGAGETARVYPTMSDICLAMALLYFRERNCDVAVLETGLGGRFDSTNAVGTPEVSVITKIGYDHMAILGDTLPAIAAEKAGILKEGTHLIAESQTPEAAAVLTRAAKLARVKSCRLIRPEEIKDCRYEGGRQKFLFGEYGAFDMGMLGTYQYENAAAAILAAEAFLKEQKKEQITTAIREGIRTAHWRGRMEILSETPFLLVDGAHNSNGAQALRDSLAHLFPGEKFHFVMGVMADKEYARMAEILRPLALDFRAVTVENARALQAAELVEAIEKTGIRADIVPDLREFLKPFGAGRTAVRAERTVAFGSLYFVGDIERLLGAMPF